MEAISRAMLRIRGSYAFGVIFKDYPGKLFAARKDSPLIIGKSENGSLIASDVPAILDQTRRVYYIGNLEIASFPVMRSISTISTVKRLRKTLWRSSGMQLLLRRAAMSTLC